MSPADYINISILFVLFLTLLAILRQMVVQNRLLNAQVLRDRFERYWQVFEPISDYDISTFEFFAENYMSKETYKNKYKDKREAICKFLTLVNMYEYLSYTLAYERWKIQDMLSEGWRERWVREMIIHNEFLDVHEYLKNYHGRFGALVDNIIKNEIERKILQKI